MKRTTIHSQKHLYMIQVNALQFAHRQKGNLYAAMEFPLNANHPAWHWTDDLKQAMEWFNTATPEDGECDNDDEVHVALFHCELDINSFFKNWDEVFRIESDNTQELIPYEVDYSLTEIARRKIKL